MRRISSTWTAFFKKLVIGFWLACLALFCVGSRVIVGPMPLGAIAFMCVIVLIMGGFGYLVMRLFIWPLMDEVNVEGDAIMVRNHGQVDRFPLTNIFSVQSIVMVLPERITLRLKQPCAFGDKVIFIAPLRFIPFPRHPVAKELAELSDAYLTYF